MSESEIISVNEHRYEVSGRMTFSTVPGLLDKSKEKFDTTGTEIIFDLTKVIHSDSAGLALMLEWCRLAGAAKKKIKFIKVPAQLLNLTEVSGLSHILIFSGE